MLTVSIIIVSYKVKDLLMVCLQSVKKNFPAEFNYEIIVADNNSNDGSIDVLKKMFPEVKLIENKYNCGFSEANNQGIGIAKGDLIFLLNPDTELRDDSMIHLLRFISGHPANIIVAPNLINQDGSFQNSCYKFPRVSQIVLETFYLHLIFNNRTYRKTELRQKRQVDALSGAAMIFKKELVSKIGMLDENLFWMEDIDFCFRNAEAGGLNWYFPQTVIMHCSGKSSKKNYNVSIANQVISKIKYMKKHEGKMEVFISFVFSYVHALTRIAVFLILTPFSKKYLLKFKAYVFTIIKLNKYLLKREVTIVGKYE